MRPPPHYVRRMQHKALMTLCWSLLLLVPGSSGFMEDLQEVFTDAKEYIKGAVPYVKELYSTVERAYVSRTIILPWRLFC